MKSNSRANQPVAGVTGRGILSCFIALSLSTPGFFVSECLARSTSSGSKAVRHERYREYRKRQIAALPFRRSSEKKEEGKRSSEKKDEKAEEKSETDSGDKKKGKSGKRTKAKKRLDTKREASDEQTERAEERDAKSDKKKKAKKDKKKKRRGFFLRGKSREDGDPDVVVEEVDILEVEPESSDEASSLEKATADEEQEESKIVDEPRLLPDSALMSVLKDLSKSMQAVDEELGIDDENEKLIIGLAKKILDQSLAGDGIEADRILAPENHKEATTSMTVEAWSSGEVKIDEQFWGSVAAVWGKRVNGLLNVTIAGDCKNQSLADGAEVGKFVVVISGKSPVKKGFDIQSQSDVTFWIGELGGIDVDAACCNRPEEPASDDQSGSEDGDDDSEASDEPVKKKTLVVLEPVLTEKIRQYLALLADYQEQQKVLALREAEKETEADESGDQPVEIADNSREDEPDEATNATTTDEKPEQEQVAAERDADTKSSASERLEEPQIVTVESEFHLIQDIADKNNVSQAEKEQRSDSTVATASRGDGKTDQRKAEARTDLIAQKAESGNRSEASRDSRPAGDDRDSRVSRAGSDSPREKRDGGVKKASSAGRDYGDDRDPWRDPAGARGSEDSPSRSRDGDDNRFGRVEEKTASGETAEGPGGGWRESRAVKPVNTTKLERISLVPASASSRRWESPATTLVTRKPSLGASVILPARAIAGKFLTVAVLSKSNEPERAVELSFNGATLTTDVKGQAMFMVPEDATPGRSLHVSLVARPELSPGVVDVLQPLVVASSTKPPSIDRTSRMVPSSDVLIVDGHNFKGLARDNRVMIDDINVGRVVAASPVQMQVALPKDLRPGRHRVRIESGGLRSNSTAFEFIKAQIIEKKRKKDVKKLLIKVEGTQNPVHIRLINRTPDVIRLSKGNNLIVTTSGGIENSYSIGVKRLKKGDYRVDARIEI